MKDNKIIFVANRSGNVYTINFDDLDKQTVEFLAIQKIVGYGIDNLVMPT